MNISVVIPTFRNHKQLVLNLIKNLPFLDYCQVIIVNDDPNQSIQKLINQFTKIILIENHTNLGFPGAVNIGVSNANNEFVMLLNDDVILRDDYFKKTIEEFSRNPSLFAVSFAQVEKDGIIGGKNILYYKNGFIMHNKAPNIIKGRTAWAEGGSMIFNKDKFIKLGGFDKIYSPFYWEDIDLSYRAWKAGYEIVFDPEIVVDHKHESTIGSNFSRTKINSIAYRNQLIFFWKNIDDSKMRISHISAVLRQFMIGLIKLNSVYIKGSISAIIKFISNPKNKKLSVRSDYEVLEIFKK
ncbi:hypothetical protein COY14_03930 [Candidatus Roizmanbacteria bacterium CG_4_10_14_0_2_um_filter_36_9]|uniref:Glycosyltransferase 2-like domain-containing protein n=2 Tax=Candidatus Roizmaniibacteriota TaxID=1752723 RepID=A0A2M7U2Z4_9BACT|nr:MAG: hypothetical protein COY14_03930 [Candidatus Roizmanbacteria bacterium CG_4_10_14_0_2_um_filter_36_9]